MIDQEDNELLAALKRADPHHVRAYAAGDDEYREIAVPTRRRKWAAVMEAIASVRWTRLEFLNKAGQLLGGFERGEPTTIEDISAPSTARAGELRALMDVMLKGQERALAYRDKEIGQVLQAIPEILKMMTSAMQSMAGMYQAQVQAAADIATANADDPVAQITELAKTVPGLMPLLAPILGRVLPAPAPPRSARPASPPNGQSS